MRSISVNMRKPSTSGLMRVPPLWPQSDRNFLHLEPELAGKEKNLGVESPTLDFLQRERLPGRRPG